MSALALPKSVQHASITGELRAHVFRFATEPLAGRAWLGWSKQHHLGRLRADVTVTRRLA